MIENSRKQDGGSGSSRNGGLPTSGLFLSSRGDLNLAFHPRMNHASANDANRSRMIARSEEELNPFASVVLAPSDPDRADHASTMDVSRVYRANNKWHLGNQRRCD